MKDKMQLGAYRSSAMVKAESKAKVSYGLIRNIPEKPHDCKLPGFFYRIFSWLTLRPYGNGTLYRCSKCNSVYRFTYNYNDELAWNQTSTKSWYEAFGEELPKNE